MRLTIGVGLILCAFAVVAIVAYFGNQELYLSVDELMGDPTRYPAVVTAASADGTATGQRARRIQVRGVVDRGSVEVAPDGLEAGFSLLGELHRLPVSYRGMLPDTFARAETVTVAGVVGDGGVFQADTIAAQCPSKYEARLPTAGAEQESPAVPSSAPPVGDDG